MSELPWLEPSLAQLSRMQATGRLPQALLVHDRPGAGGGSLLLHFAKLVLCTGDEPACGRCGACGRVIEGRHPDLLFVDPDPESKLRQIVVDQVRELSATLAQSSYEGHGTVAILRPADALNRAAANALLKTLEEPRGDAYLLLLTSQPSRLPATILSRCQRLPVPAPTREQALAFLASRGGGDWAAALDVLGLAPLEALEHDPAALRQLRDDVLATLRDAATGRLDVVRAADRWSRDEPELRLRAIENQLTALAGQSAAGTPGTPELRASTHLPAAGFDINIRAALLALDEVRDLRRSWSTPIAKPLALEALFWRLAGLAGRSPAGRPAASTHR